MLKTSVYLPEALKKRLAQLASVTGRSEADLIREAIDAHLAAHGDDHPAPGSNSTEPPVPAA